MKKGRFTNNEDALKAREIGMSVMPLGSYYFSFRKREIEHPDLEPELAWYIGIPSEYAEELQFDQIKGVVDLPSRSCVYTVFDVSGMEQLNWNALTYVMDFLAYNHFCLDGDVYGRSIVGAIDKDKKLIRYFEAWLPVAASRM